MSFQSSGGFNPASGNYLFNFLGNVGIGTSGFLSTFTTPVNGLVVQGNVGIGTTSPSTALQVNGTTTSTLFSGSGAGLTTIGTTNLTGITGTPSATTFLAGNGTWATVSSGSLSGGVTNEMPLWTSATTLGTSNIFQSGSNIGIGTTTPVSLLDIEGGGGGQLTLGPGSGSNNAAINLVARSSGTAETVGLLANETAGFQINAPGDIGLSNSGTFNPFGGALLQVNNNVAIGASYINTSAPTNGLIVQGNVGIGTTVPSSTLTVAGTIQSTSGGVKFPDGTTQTSASTGAGVPSGLIAAFATTTCPTGWTVYAPAVGRFLRGIDTASNTSDTQNRAPGSTETDTMQGHVHGQGYVNSVGLGAGSFPYGSSGASTGTPITDGTNGTPRTGLETRPVNVAVTFCQKS